MRFKMSSDSLHWFPQRENSFFSRHVFGTQWFLTLENWYFWKIYAFENLESAFTREATEYSGRSNLMQMLLVIFEIFPYNRVHCFVTSENKPMF